jgi:F-type H+-transporting ATPase subunit delta
MEELARVYATSLFQAASDAKRRQVLRDQLDQLVAALRERLEFQVFLFSPYFSTQEKKEGLRKAITGADPLLLAFLDLLIEKHRTPVLFRIAEEFRRLCARAERRLEVELTTAVELEESLAEQIGRHTKMAVDLRSKVDPEIIGGLVLRVGNVILDNSIRARLAKLRREVAQAA